MARVGLSKGGLGGASLLGVPLMALVMPPVTAAAILLPVPVVMDVVGVASWRRRVDWRIMRQIMPAAVAGIGIGWASAELVSDSMVRLIAGRVFVIRAIGGTGQSAALAGARPAAARLWGGRLYQLRRPCRIAAPSDLHDAAAA